jgi:hypothetical protein
MTGNLALGNYKITGLTPGTGTGEALAFQQLFNQGTQADIASAATTDIGVQNTNFLRVTGNTTITSFGTNYRGPRFLVFEQNITLTNSSTLVLPGGANLAVTAGDALIVIPGATLGTADKWVVVAYCKNAIPLETALTATSSGNLGLGVTPSAWDSSWSSIENKSFGGYYSTNGGFVGLAANAYYGASGWVYKGNTSAVNYEQRLGSSPQHAWFTAPVGTAGNAISFTQAMTLDASGNLGVGTTSPSLASGKGVVVYNSTVGGAARLALKNGSTGDASTAGFQLVANGLEAYIEQRENSFLAFTTNNTERARIDSSGNLIQTVNTTAATLTTNQTLTFSIVDNSTLRISVRGSDGTTRTATVALT